ncbi:hypothetical protein ACEPAF_5516 [Sanghuangporus sanghuang]
MPVALNSLQSKDSQVRRASSRYAPILKGANRKYAFTAKEVLCFLQSKGLTEIAKAIDFVTDADIEWIVKSGGFTRPYVEDKMVECAFETLAAGLPPIPPGNVINMLEYSKTKKLGAAYGIENKNSWSKLKVDLDAKRKEILEAYRKHLIPGDDIEQYDVVRVQATGHNFSVAFAHRTPGIKAGAPLRSQSRNPVPSSECTSSVAPMGSHASPTTISQDSHEESRSPQKEAKKSSGQRARYRSSEAGRTSIPCYVTMRRKKGFKRQEVQKNTLRSVPSIDGDLSKRELRRTLYASQNYGMGRTEERIDKSILIIDRNEGEPEGNAYSLPESECMKHETVSVRSDNLDVFQLAQSPEDICEPEAFGFSDNDDWTDEPSPAIRSSTCADDLIRSGQAESPTTITLRKLAELRERIIEEKRTGVWYQRQRQRDFMNSPDSDYTFSDACRSPRPRQQCTFAFRGSRIEAPAAAERPSRQRHPAWYVREDPGSPTPMRAVLPRR